MLKSCPKKHGSKLAPEVYDKCQLYVFVDESHQLTSPQGPQKPRSHAPQNCRTINGLVGWSKVEITVGSKSRFAKSDFRISRVTIFETLVRSLGTGKPSGKARAVLIKAKVRVLENSILDWMSENVRRVGIQ